MAVVTLGGFKRIRDQKSVAGGSAISLTQNAHAGRLILLDTAAGTTVTLPQALGTGAVYRFKVSVLATSNSHVIKVGNTTDQIRGIAVMTDTDTAGATISFAAAASDDTITLNRSTTGSVTIGEDIEIIDVSSGVFMVRANLAATGTPATPFSATV